VAGAASPIRFRDQAGRELWEVGLLSGVVFEGMNRFGFDPDHDPSNDGYLGGVAIQRYYIVELDRANGSIPPSNPTSIAAAEQVPDFRIPVKYNSPDGIAEDCPLIGVSLDVIRSGETKKVAGPGCIVPVKIHHQWDVNGRYVVSGDGADGGGIKNTIVAGRTLGFCTTLENMGTGTGSDVGYVGVFIHPM